MKTKTVCFVATYYAKDYIRQQMVLKALNETSFKVIECIENEKSVLRYPKVLLKFLMQRNNFDLVVVGFRGQEIMPFIRAFTSKPIVFDAFISFYDRVCFDRELFSPESLPGKVLLELDRKACLSAEKVLLDTNAHIKHFSRITGVPSERFEKLLIGCNDKTFFPMNKVTGSKFVVLWYGSFVPLQGVQYILGAALRLKDYSGIQFLLIGSGKLKKKFLDYCKDFNLDNVVFLGKVETDKIPFFIGLAGVCIGGHFEGNQSSKTVIAGKVFEMIAMAKPVIVGRSDAVKELFVDGKDVLMCDMRDSDSLSQAILELKRNSVLAKRIGLNAYETYLNNATPRVLGKQLKKTLEVVLNE